MYSIKHNESLIEIDFSPINRTIFINCSFVCSAFCTIKVHECFFIGCNFLSCKIRDTTFIKCFFINNTFDDTEFNFNRFIKIHNIDGLPFKIVQYQYHDYNIIIAPDHCAVNGIWLPIDFWLTYKHRHWIQVSWFALRSIRKEIKKCGYIHNTDE